MGRGFSGKVLFVDLSRGTTEVRAIREEIYRRYLGGSGLGAKLLTEVGDPAIDPFDPRNPLIFCPGLLAGTLVPGATRTSVCAKAPLTGIFGEAAAGGTFGAELKFCGLDAIVITGAASRPVYLWVQDATAEVRPADHLWGLDTFEVSAAVQRETDERARVATIGLAGENRVRYGAVMFEGEQARAAGRTGMGAVMGSKMLKAVAVRGRQAYTPADPKGLMAWSLKYQTDLPSRFGLFTKYGTTAALEAHEERGAVGIRNWGGSQFKEEARRIGGKAIEAAYPHKQSSCNGCPIHCWILVEEKGEGRSRGRGPEYETLGSLGSMLLISDLPAVIRANELANRHGMDTISLGNTIAFAVEAYERGLLTLDDTGGIPLGWGDGETVAVLIERIARREGFGDLLAEGSRIMARKMGRGAEELTVEVKGLEFPMHDPRAFWSSALNYAAGSRGACHLDALAFVVESGAPMKEFGYDSRMSPFTADGKALLVHRMHDLMGLYNATGMCKFYIRAEVGPQWLSDAVNLVTGWGIGWEELMRTGDRIFTLKRLFNVRAGVTRKDDTVPRRVVSQDRSERNPRLPLEAFDRMLEEYYQVRGWDPEGRPGEARLELLGLAAREEVFAG